MTAPLSRPSSRSLGGRLLGIAAALLGAFPTVLLVTATPAAAHPLGNFTVNRYSGVVVAVDQVRIDHVLDLAEIPTAQARPVIDSDKDGSLSASELAGYAGDRCRTAAARISVDIGGQPVALRPDRSTASTAAGQAGLPLLRVECQLSATVRISGTTRLTVTDGAAGERIGWREVTARGDGATLVSSDVPARSVSKRLTAYPNDLLSSPSDQREARLTVRPGGPRLTAGSGAATSTGLPRAADRFTAAFAALVTNSAQSLLLTMVAVLAAVALGSAHALAPGHGKTVMAFYLSGRTSHAVRDAVTVGATVTATHTAGVLLLGLLVSTTAAFAPATVYPWLTAISGILILTVGLVLLRTARGGHGHVHSDGHSHVGGNGRAHAHPHGLPPVAVAATQPARTSGHAQAATLVRDHSFDHDHDHDHGHSHDHPGHDHPHSVDLHWSTACVPDSDPRHEDAAEHRQDASNGSGRPGRSGSSLVAMGVAGGLLPSPSALVVLLGAVAIGRPWFGVLLVLAFGLGMAATLSLAGLLVARVRHRLTQRARVTHSRRLAALAHALPVLTALVVVGLGGVIAARGLLSAIGA